MNNHYRNKKLTQSAKHESCVSCGADDGTVVWAHSNSSKHGKGMGIKAHDLFGAYLCSKCHYIFDEGSCAGVNKTEWFFMQWERSMIIACSKGYL
jgi:RNA polymerase subunit RPABC4/transcription elongation factor Spt4